MKLVFLNTNFLILTDSLCGISIHLKYDVMSIIDKNEGNAKTNLEFNNWEALKSKNIGGKIFTNLV